MKINLSNPRNYTSTYPQSPKIYFHLPPLNHHQPNKMSTHPYSPRNIPPSYPHHPTLTHKECPKNKPPPPSPTHINFSPTPNHPKCTSSLPTTSTGSKRCLVTPSNQNYTFIYPNPPLKNVQPSLTTQNILPSTPVCYFVVRWIASKYNKKTFGKQLFESCCQNPWKTLAEKCRICKCDCTCP